MRHREWSRKDGTGFTVLSLTIAEEKRFGCRIIVSQAAGLTHEATAQHRPVIYVRTGRDDKIVTDNPVSNMHRSFLITIDTTVIDPVLSIIT